MKVVACVGVVYTTDIFTSEPIAFMVSTPSLQIPLTQGKSTYLRLRHKRFLTVRMAPIVPRYLSIVICGLGGFFFKNISQSRVPKACEVVCHLVGNLD
jgi:hypothetical protein